MHTPLPWRYRNNERGIPTVEQDTRMPLHIATVSGDLDAEFIAHACNHHAELVEALDAVKRHFDGYRHRCPVMDKVDTILAKVKGKDT